MAGAGLATGVALSLASASITPVTGTVKTDIKLSKCGGHATTQVTLGSFKLEVLNEKLDTYLSTMNARQVIDHKAIFEILDIVKNAKRSGCDYDFAALEKAIKENNVDGVKLIRGDLANLSELMKKNHREDMQAHDKTYGEVVNFREEWRRSQKVPAASSEVRAAPIYNINVNGQGKSGPNGIEYILGQGLNGYLGRARTNIFLENIGNPVVGVNQENNQATHVCTSVCVVAHGGAGGAGGDAGAVATSASQQLRLQGAVKWKK